MMAEAAKAPIHKDVAQKVESLTFDTYNWLTTDSETALIAIGPSSSVVGTGMPRSSSASSLPSYGAQSSRPSSREYGTSTRIPCSHAQLRNSRVFGSSFVDRYAAIDWMPPANCLRCPVMATVACSRAGSGVMRRRSRISARSARFSLSTPADMRQVYGLPPVPLGHGVHDNQSGNPGCRTWHQISSGNQGHAKRDAPRR